VFSATRPENPADARSWARPVFAAGDGAEAPLLAPIGAAARLLHEAVRTANGLTDVISGPQLRRGRRPGPDIPRVQQIMRDRGWLGPTVYDLAGARPLSEIRRAVHSVRGAHSRARAAAPGDITDRGDVTFTPATTVAVKGR